MSQTEGETAIVKGLPSSSSLQTAIPETLKEDSFKDVFEKTGKISIKPFVDPNVENMGLEEYGMAVFPGIHHEEQLAAIERHGVVRYITGLDEFAPEIQSMRDAEMKASVIRNIRTVVAYLEKLLATNVLDIEDKMFWNDVKLLRPDNLEFWSKITIRCSNEPMYLEPSKDPYDLIKFMAIEAGGFDIICKSHEDALAQPVNPKFFLDKETHTVSTRTIYKKLRNKAIGLLDKISEKNFKKLLYITKVISPDSPSYKVHTPSDILYDVLDDYINGLGVESNKSKAAIHFTEIAGMDMETLKLKAVVKDASFFKVISLKADGMLYHTTTSTMLGKNVSDVVTYLKNPLYEDMLSKLLDDVEGFWNK